MNNSLDSLSGVICMPFLWNVKCEKRNLWEMICNNIWAVWGDNI